MSFFSFLRPQSRNVVSQAKRPAVKKAAHEALREYEKTFIELARYD